jgi:dipeptidase E
VKFYLSSYKIGSAVERLKRLLPAANKRLAYIANAMDWLGDLNSRSFMDRYDLDQLQSLRKGLEIEQLDLRDYFGRQRELKSKLLTFGTIWVRGGNTFVLRQAMRLCGFDNILRQLADANVDTLYGGYSAGVCVLGPTLRGIDIVDPPSEKPYGEHQTIWDGLGILDYVIVPHFESDDPETSEGVHRVAAYLERHKIPFKPLRDGEVIIIDNG